MTERLYQAWWALLHNTCNCSEVQKFLAHLATLRYVVFRSISWSARSSWVYVTEIALQWQLSLLASFCHTSRLPPAYHHCRRVCESYLTSDPARRSVVYFAHYNVWLTWHQMIWNRVHAQNRQTGTDSEEFVHAHFPHCHHILYCTLHASRRLAPLWPAYHQLKILPLSFLHNW